VSNHSRTQKIKVENEKVSETQMLKNEYLKQWTRIVSEKMAKLSIPQVVGLATWSFGMVMTKSSSLTKVSQFIAPSEWRKTLLFV